MFIISSQMFLHKCSGFKFSRTVVKRYALKIHSLCYHKCTVHCVLKFMEAIMFPLNLIVGTDPFTFLS